MKHYPLLCSLVLLLLFSCKDRKLATPQYQTETLKIQQLSKKVFLHVSYLQTQNFGNVGCNGMIFVDHQEAIVFDTPTDDAVSTELINYIEQTLKAKVKAVVINHFHIDCLGGLNAFHQRGIPSYANQKSIQLARQKGSILPQQGFEGELQLTIGKEKVINQYFGEAHSVDNIVSYIPSEKALFGGCMVKSLNAGKGNLNDANTDEWANTIRKIRDHYSDLRIVVPGHGKTGGSALLDFTIALFSS